MQTCNCCKKEKKNVSERSVKENGALGYYDRKVIWCDECVNSHNYYLMASWG
jgi:hypothetical protein